MEERETLDGCKLMQSMIHDLDNDLENVRSFAAHEEELYGRIIPLIYDTFELMDDKTSDVLEVRRSDSRPVIFDYTVNREILQHLQSSPL